MRSSMIKPGVPAPGFVKRIGAIVDERRCTEFRSLDSAELVNRLTDARMPFGWTVNPYRGCEFGCRYCYARPTHGYLGHANPEEFEQRIYVKRADDGRLVARLRKARESGEEVAIGTATDPYQPAEGRFGVTRSVLEAVRRVPGLRVGITTKSPAVTRDLELLREIAASGEVMVNVSIASKDAALLRRIEPRAPRPDLRLAAMAELTAAGVATRLFAMPVLPYLTDGEAELEALFHAAREAGAREAIWNVLFLRGETHGFFLEFIGREFPRLLARYRELYAGGASAESAYRARIGEMAERLALRAGFPGRSRDDRIAAERPARRQQLELTW
ncbi:MAG: radical SAM protein [Candidatus Rokuibacteriota bacterium]|nr:MAG: radical SAM protein [Candidatus Rokubacteria bacterium]